MKITKDIPKDYFPEIDELPGDLSHLAEIIETVSPTKGVEATLAVAREFRGTSIYCHNIDALQRKARNRWLIEEYGRGGRVPDLARKVGLGERQVWTILSTEPE